MTLACGKTSSVVAKLSTCWLFFQSSSVYMQFPFFNAPRPSSDSRCASSASDRRTTRVVAGLGGLICRLTKASAFCFGTLTLGPVRYLFRAVRGGALRGGSRACPAFLFTCLRAHILPRVKAGGQLGSQFLSPSVALLTRPPFSRRGVAAAKSSIVQFVRAPSDDRGLFEGVAV